MTSPIAKAALAVWFEQYQGQPLTQEVLEALTVTLELVGLEIYTKKVVKNPPRRPQAQKVTLEVREAILKDFKDTGLTQQQIASKHNVNIGRVNEIVHALAPEENCN